MMSIVSWDRFCLFCGRLGRSGIVRALDLRGSFGSRSGGRSADRQWHRRKRHLIEAAPFGRLNQMQRRSFKGRVLGGFAPPAKSREVWGAAPPSPNRRKKVNKNFSKLFYEKEVIAKELGLNLNKRPEQLTNEMFYKIAAKYEKLFG